MILSTPLSSPLVPYWLGGASLLSPTILYFSTCRNSRLICYPSVKVEMWRFLILTKKLSFLINSLIASSSPPTIDSISFYHVGCLCLQVTFSTFHFISSVDTQSGFRRHDWLMDLLSWKQSLFQIDWSFSIHTQRFFLKGIKQQSCCFHIVERQ